MATLPLPSHVYGGGVLVASSDANLREQIVSTLNTQKWPVMAAHGGADALGKLENSECDVLLLDQQLSDLDSRELVRTIEAQYPGIEILQLDAKTRNVIGRPRRWTPGVSDVFRVLERLTGVANDRPPCDSQAASDPPEKEMSEPLPGMIGNSESMHQIFRMVRLVAKRSTTVLITGATGSGKELVARAVHQLSDRSGAPFVVINCAAIPEALLEAELFGYTRGAFTGAVQPRSGRIQAAQGGTLFLDEIGDLPLSLQAKLLRFLERGEVQRLGSNDVVHVDVRVVAATNADLLEKVEKREFREDLYYRLSVFPVQLPPLAERKEDIPLLAQCFLAQFSPDRPIVLRPEALEFLREHSWPGNVRELMHVLERALIFANGAPMIEVEHIRFSPLIARPEPQAPRKGPVCA